MNRPHSMNTHPKTTAILRAFFSGIFTFGLFIYTPQAWTLESDREQPIEITADAAVLDEIKQQAIYSGNVELIQGSLTIHAKKLIVNASSKGEIEKITATGNLAKFTQVPEINEPPIIAKAKKIFYFIAEERLLLNDTASVTQENNVFQGDTINYDIKRQKLTASGSTDTQIPTEGDAPKGRVRMILPPPSQPTRKEPIKTNEQTDSIPPSQKLQK